tara:strand:- start:1742 stop:1978 length:237 start_codon:yes stop_codon:yes gene_type:complete
MVKNMTEKKKTGKKSKDALKVEELEEAIETQNTQLIQISNAYQELLAANSSLQGLVGQYERTINLLTARLIESQQSQG